MGQTPIIEIFPIASNVDSAIGDVEHKAPNMPLAVLLALVLAVVLSGCVETAECNATVSCPDQQVCYEYTCREACQAQQDCAEAQSCTPCMAEGAADDEGQCFGEDLSACVPEGE